MIAGILLAAGRSARYGSDKRLQEISGRPLIYYSLRACIESSLSSVYVVVASLRSEVSNLVERLFPGNKKIRLIENPAAMRGQMSSVNAGLRALPQEVVGAMVVLADMPLVTSEWIDRLISVFNERRTVTVSESGGKHYHPKILPRGLFPQFLQLGDSERGTVVLETVADQIATVAVSDPSQIRDVDHPTDLADVKRLLSLIDREPSRPGKDIKPWIDPST